MNTLISYPFTKSSLANYIDEFFGNSVLPESKTEIVSTTWPKIDITEDNNGYTLRADLPGVDKKDVRIQIDKNILKIEGEKKSEYKQEKGRYYHFERSYGQFSRSFVIPDGTDNEKIEAKMDNGVLELTIPKAKQEKPRAIEVKI